MTKINGKSIRIELTEEEVLRRLDEIENANISQDLREFMIGALKALIRLDELIGMKETTIARLRKIFGKKTERKKPKKSKKNGGPKGRAPGQGNHSTENYPQADQKEHVLGSEHKAGQKCPDCKRGTLYPVSPGLYIRISGSPVLRATVHRTEKTRCSACGNIFEANFESKNQGKYNHEAKSIIAIMHYQASLPFYRLEKIQKAMMTPVSRSVQWNLMEELANTLHPIWKEFLRLAPNANMVKIDDTTGKVLSIMAKNKAIDKKTRTGMFTTGLITEHDDFKLVLFFTGQKHSGENLEKVMAGRVRPIAVMSDALSRNTPSGLNILKYLCLVHARRNFLDLSEHFESEVAHVLGLIADVYKNEKNCTELNPKERLDYHQAHSAGPMNDLKSWCEEKIELREVEPNSSLGKAIKYVLKHWEGLSAFLKHEGAPLDNNELEQQLRTPVLNRKNWLFYKTEFGALVGDIILSLIKTCEAARINAFDYFNWIQLNKARVRETPELCMPWNYKTPLDT